MKKRKKAKRAKKRGTPGTTEQLRRFWNVAKQVGGFAFDFECVDERDRPTTNAMVARPVLLSLATGKHRPFKALVLEWNKTTSAFLRGLLKQSDLAAVAHYHNYDLLVAHWSGCIDIREVQARIADTRLLAWMYNEEDDLGLKGQAMLHFKHRMVSFREATVDSEFYQANLVLSEQIKGLHKEAREKERLLKKEARERTRAGKKELDELWPDMKGLTPRKEFNQMKRDYAEKVKGELDAVLEELHDIVQKKTIVLELKMQENDHLAYQLFKKYALDDAIQCWRLYLKLIRWIDKAKLRTWLMIEESNHLGSLQMTAHGAYVNEGKLDGLRERSEPLLEEFEANIHAIAKREFNVRSNKDLPEVIYRDLGVTPPEGTKRSKVAGIAHEPWAYSTKTEVLQRIEHPIAQAILDYRSVQIIYKNFIIGLLEQVRNDPNKKSKVHVTFNSTGTRTGRWSSSTG